MIFPVRHAGEGDEVGRSDTFNRHERGRWSKSYLQSRRYHDNEGSREHDGFRWK